MSDQAPQVKKPYPFGRRARHYLSNLLIVGIIRTALALPYKARLSFCLLYTSPSPRDRG